MWRGVVVGLAIMAGASLVGCSAGRRPVSGPTEHGIASWYGPGFHGKQTTSGEVYDQNDMTAAHPTLPLGTHVTVTNLQNLRSVTVRINDRGPFVDDRAIDLSYAAAQALDMVGPGTAPVRIDVHDVNGDVLPAAMYAVQVGSFADRYNADNLQAALRRQFEAVYVAAVPEASPPQYRVRIGPFRRQDDASRAAARVTSLGLPAIVIEDGVTAH